MRFTNVLIALGSVANVVNAFQGVSDGSNLDVTDDNVYHNAATTLLPVRLNALADKKGGKKADITSTSKWETRAAVATTATTSSNAVTAGACSIKRSPRLRFIPRDFDELKKSPDKPGEDGSYNLLENEWVTAATLKSGDKVSVTDITGCSAVFLWNKDDVPSVFHIFCAAGAEEAPRMAAEVSEMGPKTKPVAVTIAARDEGEVKIIQKAILDEFGTDCDPQCLTDDDFENKVYDNGVPEGRLATEAYRFEAVAGIRKVTQSKEPKVSQQGRSFSSYF